MHITTIKTHIESIRKVGLEESDLIAVQTWCKLDVYYEADKLGVTLTDKEAIEILSDALIDSDGNITHGHIENAIKKFQSQKEKELEKTI